MKKFLLLSLACVSFLSAFDINDALKKGAELATSATNGDTKSLLSSAINQAVGELQKGFINNATAKIDLPPALKAAAGLAKKAGGDKWASEIESSINEAATKAVGGASEVFMNTIKNMSEADVKSLISGGDDAMSAYLQKNSGAKLKEVFKPIINDMMSKKSWAGAYNGLNSFISNSVTNNASVQNLAKNLGMSEHIPAGGTDINDYITDKTLEGLFAVMREKESSFRSDGIGKVLNGILR